MQLIWSTAMLVDKSWNWSPRPKPNGSLQALGLRRPGWAPSFAVWWWSAHTSKEVANRLWLGNCGSYSSPSSPLFCILWWPVGNDCREDSLMVHLYLWPWRLKNKQVPQVPSTVSSEALPSPSSTVPNCDSVPSFGFSGSSDTYNWTVPTLLLPLLPLATRLTHLPWCVR